MSDQELHDKIRQALDWPLPDPRVERVLVVVDRALRRERERAEAAEGRNRTRITDEALRAAYAAWDAHKATPQDASGYYAMKDAIAAAQPLLADDGVWPSQHAQHAVLLDEIRELSARAERAEAALEEAREVLALIYVMLTRAEPMWQLPWDELCARAANEAQAAHERAARYKEGSDDAG